jgi:transcriptional regulator with XRE-family HTH domain
LERLLDERDLKQNEFAGLIGMMPQQINCYVRGRQEPRDGQLDIIAAGLGLPDIEELIRMPPGIGSEKYRELFDNVIEVRQSDDRKIEIANKLVKLILRSNKCDISEESLDAIDHLINIFSP